MTIEIERIRFHRPEPFAIGRICKGYKYLKFNLPFVFINVKVATKAGDRRYHEFMREWRAEMAKQPAFDRNEA